MGCAMGTIRYILFFFNFILALAGLGVLILGVTVAHSEGASFAQGHLTTPAIMFSIVGACVFVFAFFGCCGALRESHCMVCTYAVLLLTLFLLQVAVAVYAYTNKSETKELVSKSLQTFYEKYNSDNSTRSSIDSQQQELHCCGSVDVETPWKQLGIPTPTSCYPNKDTSKDKFTTPCISAFIDLLESGLSHISQTAMIIAAVQVVGIVFALCLANSIRRQDIRGFA